MESTGDTLNEEEADPAAGKARLEAEPGDSGALLVDPRPWPHDGVVRVWAY